VTKIRRLIASSVAELTFDNVTVVSDRSRFTDVSPQGDSLSNLPEQQMATVWSITMQESGVGRFQVLFFTLTSLILFFALLAGWMAWKLYPLLPQGGLRRLFSLKPLVVESSAEEQVGGESEPPAEG
jgi:type III secretion protein J